MNIVSHRHRLAWLLATLSVSACADREATPAPVSAEHLAVAEGVPVKVDHRGSVALANQRARSGSLDLDALAARADDLRALAAGDPAAALAAALDDETLDRLRAADPAADDLLERHASWAGEARFLLAANRDGSTETGYVLIGETPVHLVGKTAPVRSGDRVRVAGVLLPGGEEALSSDVSVDLENTAPPTCSAVGTQSAAVFYVNYPGITNPVTISDVTGAFFGTGGRTLGGFWKESSLGQTTLTGSVFGPYTLDRAYACTEFPAIEAAVFAAARGTVDFTKYNRFFIVMPDLDTTWCPWTGMGDVGCVATSTPTGTVSATTTFLVGNWLGGGREGVLYYAAREGGHNLGLLHADGVTFAGETLGAPGAAGTVTDYADSYSGMGQPPIFPRYASEYAAPHRAALGWSQPKVVTAAGSTLLAPAEDVTPSSVRALQVKRGLGTNEWVWVEYRQPAGYDSTLTALGAGGVLLHWQGAAYDGNTYLLDATPRTGWSYRDEHLSVGQTFDDEYSGMRLTVRAPTSGTGVWIDVSYDDASCVNAPAPTLTLAPADAGIVANGASVNYVASLTNNAPAGCPTATFPLTGTVPGGYSFTLPATLAVAAGATATATFAVTVPQSAMSGPVALTVSTKKGYQAASAQASLTVNSSCVLVPPTVTLSKPATSAGSDDYVGVDMTVTSNSGAACGPILYRIASAQRSYDEWYYPQTLTLSAGQSGVSQLSKYSGGAAGTVLGYTSVAHADNSDPAFDGSASGTLTVLAPCVRTLSMSPNPMLGFDRIGTYVDIVFSASATCATATWSLYLDSPLGTTGWHIFAPSPSSVTLAPGQTTHATFQFLPQINVTGTWVISAWGLWNVTGGFTDEYLAEATVTIVRKLTATLALSDNKVKKGKTIQLTATTNLDGTATAGIPVSFSVKTPSGAMTTLSATTGSAGTATVNYTLPVAGSYSVTATATASSQTVTTAAVTFTGT